MVGVEDGGSKGSGWRGEPDGTGRKDLRRLNGRRRGEGGGSR